MSFADPKKIKDLKEELDALKTLIKAMN